jgi:hypothetical protein
MAVVFRSDDYDRANSRAGAELLALAHIPHLVV